MAITALRPPHSRTARHLAPACAHVLLWLAIAAVHAAALAWLVPERAAVPARVAERAMLVSFVSRPAAPAPAVQPPPAAPRQPARPVPTPAQTPSAPATHAASVPLPPPGDDARPPAAADAPPAAPLDPAASGTAAHAADVADVVPPDYQAAYLNNPGPRYPLASRRRREQGVVMLKVRVSASGAPEEVLVERSSGYAELDAAAAGVVRERWRFVPARERDLPVAAWVAVPMSFELRNR